MFDWLSFLFNMLLTALGRSLDLLSTYRVTPKLKLETNRLVSKLGWWGAICLQIPIIIIGGFLFQLSLFIFFWSLLITANNLTGTWFIKGLKDGETTYAELLKESTKKAKWYNILLDESAPFLLFSVPNLVIWILILNFEGNFFFYLLFSDTIYSYILILTGTAILHGIVGTIRNFIYILRFKREIKKEEKSNLNNHEKKP
ncbi:MAG: hypothetical protein EU551_00210 [Promethearchaeota archaeon]|nr:MAG: hypothetical protein EU551_00210 [Candidatus Lokiarchaeota archaeon]